MSKLFYRDRLSGSICQEKIYGEKLLQFLYGTGWLSRTLGRVCQRGAARHPLVSRILGWWYSRTASRRLIEPFAKAFSIEENESELPFSHYSSFNDFFTRRLRPGARPLGGGGEKSAVLPADARYRFSLVDEGLRLNIKGEELSLTELFEDPSLAREYEGGLAVIARLCPSDYHRFHFPCSGRASSPRLINGYLYSVHPHALRKNIERLFTNKRAISFIESPLFGSVAYIAIGATGVGTIHYTYTPDSPVEKGDECGFFAFGASMVMLLFQKNRLQLAEDLASALTGPTREDPTRMVPEPLEIRGLMGQPLGESIP